MTTSNADDLKQEFQTALEAAQSAPEKPEHWDALENLAGSLDNPEDVIKAYQAVLDNDLPSKLAVELGERAILFHQEWFGEDPAGQEAILRRVLELEPNAEQAFQKLSMNLTVAQRWDDLFTLYDNSIEAAPKKKRKIKLLEEAAGVAKDVAGAPDRAIDYLQKLLPLRPEDEALSVSLERLLEKHERWSDLIALWKSRLENQNKKQRLETWGRIAECWFEKLSNPRRALEAVFGLLDEDEHNAHGLELLEKVILAEQVEQDVRDRALGRLRLAYEAMEKGRDIVRVIEGVLPLVDDKNKKDLHKEAGDRLAELGDAPAAMEHYAQLLKMDPGSSVTQEKLRHLASQADDYTRYAADVAAAAEACTEVSRKAELMAEAGQIYAERLNDENKAAEVYGQALALEGISGNVVVSLGRRLREILAKLDRQTELLDVLDRLASVESVPSSKRALIGDMARLAQSLGETERALNAWRSRLEADPNDVDAINSLIELLEKEERWAELIDGLEKRVAAPVPANQKKADLIRIANVYLEKLEQPEKSIETWKRVQEIFGETDETVDALVGSYEAAGRIAEMVDLLERASAQYTTRVTHRLMMLGNACRDHLEAPERALAAYKKALLHDSRHEGAREGLKGLLQVDSCIGEAAEALVISYRENEEWRQIVELVDARLQATTDPRVHLRVLKEAASLEEQKLDDKQNAFKYLAQAFPLEPTNNLTEDHLVELAEATDQWPAAIEALRKGVEALEEDPHSEIHLRFREATLLEQKLQDNENALEAYLKVFGLAPDHRQAVAGIVRLGSRLGRWQEAAQAVVTHTLAINDLVAELIDELEQVAADNNAFDALAPALENAMGAAEEMVPHLGFDIYYRIAKWHRDKREQPAAAEESLLKAVALDGNRADALRDLAELQRAHPGRPLFDTLRRLADVDPNDLNVIGEAASVAAEHVGDRQLTRTTLSAVMGRAAAAWRGTTEAKGSQPPEKFVAWALEQLVSDYLEADEPAAAVDLLVDASRMPFDEETQLAMRRRAAAVADEQMGDADTAIEMYRSVLGRAPKDTDTIEKLAVLYEKRERFSELLSLRQHELNTLEPEPERKLHLRLELSRLVEEVVKRGGRVEALRANLAESPGHPATIEALCKVLDADGKHALLSETLTEQAQALESLARSAEAAEIWVRVAYISEHNLDQIDHAITAYRRVVALAPSGQALDALARLYMDRGEPTEAVKWLDQRLESATAEDKPSVYLRLAKAYLADEAPEEAIAALEKAQQEETTNTEIRNLLIELYRKAKKWGPLADLLTASLPEIAEEDTIVAHAREAAEIYNERLKTPEKAVPALEKALSLVPGDRTMQMQLATGLRVIERYADARKILEEIIESFGRRRSAERAAAHVELANVAKAEGNMDEALEQLDTASKMAVGNARIMRAVAEAARDAGKLDKAERSYRALLLVVRRQQQGDDEQAVGVSEVLYELHRLAQESGDEDQAKELLGSTLEEAAQSDAEVHRLRRTLLSHDAPETLLKALRARLESVDEAETDSRVLLLTDLADLLADPLERPTEALDALHEAILLAPARRDLIRRARKLAQQTERMNSFVECLTGAVKTLRRKKEADLAADLLLQAGAAVETELEDLNRAAEIYKTAEETGRRTGDALFAIARVATKTGNSEEQRRAFAALKEIATEGEPSPEQADALYRLAELQVDSDEHRSEAIALTQKALALEPRYRDAARIAQAACDAEPQNGAYIEFYEPIANAAGDWEIQLDFLERRTRLPDVTPNQVKEAVDLALAHEQPQRAEKLYQIAVDAAKEREEGIAGAIWAAVGLIGRKQETGDFRGAFALMHEIADHTAPEQLFEVGLSLAKATLDSEEPDLPLAAEIFEFLRLRRPAEPAVWAPLYEVYEKLEAYPQMAELVAATIPELGDLELRNGLRIRHARNLLRLEALPEAGEMLRDALTDNPEDVEATKLMEETLRKQGDEEALVDFLSSQFEQARTKENTELLVELVPRLGTLLEKMESPDALTVFRIGLEVAPDNPTMIYLVLERIDTEDEENAEIRVTLMERYLANATDAEQASPIARELCALREAQEDPEALKTAYELAHKACPQEETFTEKLRNFYVANELHEPLAAVLARDADHVEDPAQAVALLRQSASIYLENLSNYGAAAEVLRKARGFNPKDPTLVSELASCLAGGGDTAGAVTAISEALEQDLEGADRVQPLLLQADFKIQLNRPGEAVADLEEAYTIDAETVLPHLLTGLETQRTQATESGDDEGRRSATLRLAELLQGTEQTEKALELLQEWVVHQPDDQQALVSLRDLALKTENPEGIITACFRLVFVQQGPKQVEAAVTLAETAFQNERPTDALKPLEHAYAAQPDNPQIKTHLRTVYEQSGAHRQLADMLMTDADATADEEEKYGLLKRAAELYLHSLNDPATAIGPVTQLKEMRPDDLQITLLLVDVLIAANELDKASEILQPAIEAHKRPSPELGALLLRLARVAGASGNSADQMKWLKKAFSVARKSGEVAVEVARVAEEIEDYDLALKALRTISLGKKEAPISRAEAFLWEAKIEVTRGNRAKALLQLKKALKEDPEMSEAQQLKEELSN
jgi:tetratricopeptide (TPR) repeat protein